MSENRNDIAPKKQEKRFNQSDYTAAINTKLGYPLIHKNGICSFLCLLYVHNAIKVRSNSPRSSNFQAYSTKKLGYEEKKFENFALFVNVGQDVLNVKHNYDNNIQGTCIIDVTFNHEGNVDESTKKNIKEQLEKSQYLMFSVENHCCVLFKQLTPYPYLPFSGDEFYGYFDPNLGEAIYTNYDQAITDFFILIKLDYTLLDNLGKKYVEIQDGKKLISAVFPNKEIKDMIRNLYQDTLYIQTILQYANVHVPYYRSLKELANDEKDPLVKDQQDYILDRIMMLEKKDNNSQFIKEGMERDKNYRIHKKLKNEEKDINEVIKKLESSLTFQVSLDSNFQHFKPSARSITLMLQAAAKKEILLLLSIGADQIDDADLPLLYQIVKNNKKIVLCLENKKYCRDDAFIILKKIQELSIKDDETAFGYLIIQAHQYLIDLKKEDPYYQTIIYCINQNEKVEIDCTKFNYPELTLHILKEAQDKKATNIASICINKEDLDNETSKILLNVIKNNAKMTLKLNQEEIIPCLKLNQTNNEMEIYDDYDQQHAIVILEALIDLRLKNPKYFSNKQLIDMALNQRVTPSSLLENSNNNSIEPVFATKQKDNIVL